MFPHLQADSCAGIDKYLVTSVVNWDHLGLDHMDTPRPQCASRRLISLLVLENQA